MAGVERRFDAVVIVIVVGIIAPQVAWADGFGRSRQVLRADAVGAVEDAGDAVLACGCCAIAFVFGGGDAAAPDGAGKHPPAKPHAHWGQDKVGGFHIRCPDFAALVAR